MGERRQHGRALERAAEEGKGKERMFGLVRSVRASIEPVEMRWSRMVLDTLEPNGVS
jgi:hypothetical protein